MKTGVALLAVSAFWTLVGGVGLAKLLFDRAGDPCGISNQSGFTTVLAMGLTAACCFWGGYRLLGKK